MGAVLHKYGRLRSPLERTRKRFKSVSTAILLRRARPAASSGLSQNRKRKVSCPPCHPEDRACATPYLIPSHGACAGPHRAIRIVATIGHAHSRRHLETCDTNVAGY